MEPTLHRGSEMFGEPHYSRNPVVDALCTLRKCNRKYRDAGGLTPRKGDFEELDFGAVEGYVAVLGRFRNSVGHCATRGKRRDNEPEYAATMVVPSIARYETAMDALDSAAWGIDEQLRTHSIWFPRSHQVCTLSEAGTASGWCIDGVSAPVGLESLLSAIELTESPLSFYPASAPFEVQRLPGGAPSEATRMFPTLRETSAIPGLLGTLHNNTAVDMTPWEHDVVPDAHERAYDESNLGFVCAGHTSHSVDAGKVSRLCSRCSVRVINTSLPAKLRSIADKLRYEGAPGVTESQDHTVFCNGAFSRCSGDTALRVWRAVRGMSKDDDNALSSHYYLRTKLLVVSVSSGVILRPDKDGYYGDSLSFQSTQPHARLVSHHRPIDDAECLGFYFSPYFQLWPYIEHDRPPRPLFASVQSLQAACWPFGAGVSSVVPDACEWPLVKTQLMMDIKQAWHKSCAEMGAKHLADIPGGRNMTVCFANLNNNYEDCITVPRRTVLKGYFSHRDICVYILPRSEFIPDVGDMLDPRACKWWKCTDMSNSDADVQAKPAYYAFRSNVSGVVHSKSEEKDGSIRVEVLRTALPVSGDKLSTPHGQKGVIVIVGDDEVPNGRLDDGSIVEFDIVMSLTAVCKRQTIGQVYEAAHGWLVSQGLKSKDDVVAPTGRCNEYVSCTLVRSSGEAIIRRIDGELSSAMASFGIAYVLPMTQLSYDKQHYTHNVSKQYALEPLLRRSRGGALRLGEMELLAMSDSGLNACMAELRDRSNVVLVDICSQCNRLTNLCTCISPSAASRTALPSDMIKYDHILACTYACSFEYEL